MNGGRGRDMIVTVACGLLIFSALVVMSQGEFCPTTLRNMALYEGTLNTFIDYYTDPGGMLWLNYASTDIELQNPRYIVNGAHENPEYAADYEFYRTEGFTIKNATTTVQPGHKLSTDGLYGYECDAAYEETSMRYFKLLVVREGPTCSCIRVDSESVQMTCRSIYADAEFHPINAIFTLNVDGTSYATDTPARTSYDSNTHISTSTFTINYAASSTYQCIHTFSQPTDPYRILSGHEPLFNQQCSFVCPPAPTTPTTSTQSPTTTPGEDCSKNRQCQPEYGTGYTGIYTQRVIKAQLYTRSDECCPNNQACGVVVTLQNGNRYLIHDAVCNDNSLKMAVVAASCMSSDWKLVSERRILLSNVGAFVLAGNIAQISSIVIPLIQSCNAMMSVL